MAMLAMIGAELKRFGNTARWSWQGWRAAWASEKSLRQWTVVNVLSGMLAFSLHLTAGERALILALGLLVLAAELANTAVEELVDHLWQGHDPRAGKIKDCGSAVVAVTAIAGGVAWLVVLTG
jgi:diacylglycerol kinase (ATP)